MVGNTSSQGVFNMTNDPSTEPELNRFSNRRQAETWVSGDAPRPWGSKTICIPCDREPYPELIANPARFRHFVDELHAAHPELFPAALAEGYWSHGLTPPSAKLGLQLRRIKLKTTGEVYSVCPSFVMPYMTGYVAEVEHALFLLTFGVPFWALTHVFGRNDMYWYRLANGCGRNSLVGTTVKAPEGLPQDLLADEKHTTRQGEKAYVAMTVGGIACWALRCAPPRGPRS